MEIDPLTGLPRFVDETIIVRGGGITGGSSGGGIPEYDTDPASPEAEDAWMLKTAGGGSGGGSIVAILGGGFMASSPNAGGGTVYQLSYRTLENTTIRVTLS